MTNIQDQICLLFYTPVEVLVSTLGRLSMILRMKNAKLDLGNVQLLVLDKVNFLLVDETFGSQLKTVGVAVGSGGRGVEEGDDGDDDDGGGSNVSPQYVFDTATLPEDVIVSIQTEFPSVTQLRVLGLHRVVPAVHQTLNEVSVPPTLRRDARACFDIKINELTKALRGRSCARTLGVVTWKTRRGGKTGGRRSKVWYYQGALSHEARVRNLREFLSDGDS